MPSTSPVDPENPSSSATTFGDVVASYRRAQTFLSGSNITTVDAFPDFLAVRRDEEAGAAEEHSGMNEVEENFPNEDDVPTSRPIDIQDPLWDETLQPSSLIGRPNPNERTPLLMNRKISWHGIPPPDSAERRTPLVKRSSTISMDVKYHPGGNSTYRQTLFNSIAILLGVGMLSEPLAFSYAGWLAGTILITFYGFITCYTAKILARIIIEDSSLRTYADIGLKAFGRGSIVLTGTLFCLELFAVCVVLVTLYADSLHLVIPTFSTDQYKVAGLLIILPTLFMPLSILSYASMLGILSTILIIACIAVDGLTKRESPGSLWQPAHTEWWLGNVSKLGLAFGLFMAGFSGHAVMPSIARDMQDPSQFDKVVNCAFGVSTAIYWSIGAAGYLMFGGTVSEEISKNILATPGYPVILNNLAVWMLVVAPLSKFALTSRPLNLTLEIWFGIDEPATPPSPSRPALPTTKSAATLATSARTTARPWLLIIERITLALLAVGVSILIPEFSTAMAFLGSFSAFVLCVVGPVCAKVAIQGKCSWYDGVLLAMSIISAAWGTIAAFR